MTGLPNAQLQWRASLNRYYKRGLDDFDDAPTVRIMLDGCYEFLKQMAKLEEGLEGENLADWNKTFGEEKVAVGALIGDLEAWLTKRTLSR